jgi:hypothetical protein
MPEKFKIFCDESCHLENDNQPFMVLGGLIINEAKYYDILEKIKQLRTKYKMGIEFKWTKISKSRINFYLALIDLSMEKLNSKTDDGSPARDSAVETPKNTIIVFLTKDSDDSHYKAMKSSL